MCIDPEGEYARLGARRNRAANDQGACRGAGGDVPRLGQGLRYLEIAQGRGVGELESKIYSPVVGG